MVKNPLHKRYARIFTLSGEDFFDPLFRYPSFGCKLLAVRMGSHVSLRLFKDGIHSLKYQYICTERQGGLWTHLYWLIRVRLYLPELYEVLAMEINQSVMSVVSRRVKKLRLARGWSQAELAAKTRGKVAPKTISNLENEGGQGRQSVTLPNIAAVAAAFDLEVWQLMVPGDDDETSRPIFRKVITLYMNTNEEGRRDIFAQAELAAKYKPAESPTT